MSKFVGIKTYERFRSLWENNDIDEFSLNFILDTGQLYTHGVFINSAVFGTAANGAVLLSIAGTTNTLALSSHTHSNYYDKSENLDITNHKIISGDNDLLFCSGGALYIGNINNPTYISGSTIQSIKGLNTYTILDTENFSISNTLPTGYTHNNTAYIEYGGNSFLIDYVKRVNTSLSFDYLNSYTLAGTNLLNGDYYGYINFTVDNVYNNPAWAQLRINITGRSIQYRTSADVNNWINLGIPSIPLNALNVAGIVSAPNANTQNKVWKTDEDGNPGWRDERIYSFASLVFQQIAGTELESYNTLTLKTILAGSNISFSCEDNVITINALDTTYSAFTGASASEDGSSGLVTAPNTGDQDKFLRGDGTWNTPLNTWRPIYLLGTAALSNSSTYLNIAPGDNISLAYAAPGTETGLSGNANYATLTISATNTWIAWEGATETNNGTAGYMPAPTSALRNLFLRGDGTWISLNDYTLPTATNLVLGGIKVGTTLKDTSGYTAIHIKDGVAYYKDTTYSFSNLLFLQTSGTNLMTYNSQAARTILAGSNITFTHSDNILTIAAKDTTYSTVSKTAAGLCPILPNETTTTKYLRLDGTWVTPPDNNTWIDFTGASASAAGTKGVIQAPAGAQNKFFRGDNTWQTISQNVTSALYVGASNGTGNSAQSTNGNVYLIFAEGSSYSRYKISGSGRASVTSDASGNITINSSGYSNFGAATASAAGSAGLVPAPGANVLGSYGYYLRADGTWLKPPNDNTWKAANASQEGYVPKSTANKILRANGDGALYWGDDANTTYTFYNLLFQNSGGTIVDTYKPTTSPTKTLKAGSNVTISAASNIITIASTNTWNAMTGATSSANGTVGYVNATPPKNGYNTKFLRADGTWSVPAYPTKSSWNYNDMYVASVSISGNNLRINKNGKNTDLTIPYASSAGSATTATRFEYITNWSSPKNGANVINLMSDTSDSATTNGAPARYTSGISIVTNYVGFQLASYGGGGESLYFRKLQDNGTWHNWYEVITAANIGSQSVNYASSAGSVAWGNVSSKPATATRWPAWSEITSKPTTLSGYGITDGLYSTQVSVAQTDLTYAKDASKTIRRGFVYNTSGTEWSYLFGFTSGTNSSTGYPNYGAVYKFGYTDRYIRVLRVSGGGTWQSTDWEKTYAGYADSAGDASTLGGTAKSGLFTDFSRPSSTNNLSITIGGTTKAVTLGARAWDSTNYLPLTGGTITSTSTIPLNITTSAVYNYIRFGASSSWKGEVGVYNNFLSLYGMYFLLYAINDNPVRTMSLREDGYLYVENTKVSMEGHKHTWASITNKLTLANAFNFVDNETYSSDIWMNYASSGDTVSTNPTQTFHFCTGENTAKYANLKAKGYIKNGKDDNSILLAGGGDISVGSFVPMLGTLAMGNGSDAVLFSKATEFCTSTNLPYRHGLGYGTNGEEYTALFSYNGNWANILKWGYLTKYIYIARKKSGSWLSNDWEKIDAGYADSAGAVDWANVNAGSNSKGSFKITNGGLLVTGRINGSGDDEGICIGFASNNWATLILGGTSGERSGFHKLKGAAPVWTYNNGTNGYTITHPGKTGTIALTSDIPSQDNGYANHVKSIGTWNADFTTFYTAYDIYAKWINSTNCKLVFRHNNTDTTCVDKADTLYTSRTLWGQSFNGSANVDGRIVINGASNANNSDKWLLKVILGTDCGSAKYDSVIFSSNDATTLRLADNDGTQWGVCVNGTNATQTSTGCFRFYTGSTANTEVWNGGGGTLKLGLNYSGYDAYINGTLNVTSTITLNGTAVSLNGHTHDDRYLKLTGGTLTNNSTTNVLNISTTSTTGSYIKIISGVGTAEFGYWNGLGVYMQNHAASGSPTLSLGNDGEGYVKSNVIFRNGNAYWANVAVSTTSLTNTYPTFGNLAVINDSSDTGYDALVWFRNRSSADWCLVLDKNNAYDYGLDIRCSGTYGIRCAGDARFLNNVYGVNFYTTSDIAKKKNITTFSEHIRKFQLKDTEKWHYGVIALEVEEIFRDGEEGNLTVNYNSVLSYYVGRLENSVAGLEAAKRLLENRVKELELEVLKLKKNNYDNTK